ncbi:unnamed protein product [Oikopleura dioica]|uniref:Uncharacterized protein n=1 Tax=Oikopleura dioica TaxID=34765 RepID=E4YDD4_OIKDI|nr:unnamed protein product [Oikopleura dioica]
MALVSIAISIAEFIYMSSHMGVKGYKRRKVFNKEKNLLWTQDKTWNPYENPDYQQKLREHNMENGSLSRRRMNSRRIVGGLHTALPTGYIYQQFGQHDHYWKYCFGEKPLPPLPSTSGHLFRRARSIAESVGESQYPLSFTVSDAEHLVNSQLRRTHYGARDTVVPPVPTEDESRTDAFYGSPQYPEDPLNFMKNRKPGYYAERLTVGQIKVAKQESQLQSLSPAAWYRCGSMTSEMLKLHQSRSEQPPFGTGVSDLLEENISVNRQTAPAAQRYTESDIACVRYGVRAALECLTLGSPFHRRDLFRVDPRLHKRPESHVSGWLALAGIENVKPKGRPVQPMDFALALFLLTSFRRVFSTERSRQIAAPMLGFNYQTSNYNCSILTASDYLTLAKQVQILPIGFREVVTFTSYLQGRRTGSITASVMPQRGGCDAERETLVTRALFPEPLETVSSAFNLNLEVLLAVERAKNETMSHHSRKIVQTQETELRALEELEEPEVQIPESIIRAWEHAYFDYLTTTLSEAGLSVVGIAYILQQYGSYLIELRKRMGHNPPPEMIELLIKLMPARTIDDSILSDASSANIDVTNWLTKYHSQFPRE